jgi:hypothetical protein
MKLILLLFEIYAAGGVLLLMLFMGVNRWRKGTIPSMEVVLFAVLWPVFLLASLLWFGGYWIVGYFNGRNDYRKLTQLKKERTQEEL